jgi:hypothetical protein
MNIIKIFVISSIIMISSCGYKIVNNIDESNLQIVKTVFKGDNKINQKLDTNYKRFFDNKNATKFIKIITNSRTIKKVTSKDISGNDNGYSLEIIVSLEVYENEKILNDFKINKKINYNNLSSQFELKQYEKTLTNDLITLILIDINNYLLSIK